MSMDECPHCGDPLPAVHDAFCPSCRGSLGDVPAATPTLEPQPSGKITVDVPTEFPRLCALCGQEAQQFVRITSHRQHAVKKSLLKAIAGGGLLGSLIANETFDERPVYLSLPVCAMHISDARLTSITGIPTGSRQVTISGVHPTFVAAVNELLENRWAHLIERTSDAENGGGKRMDNGED